MSAILRPLRVGLLGSGFIAGVHAASLRQVAGVTVAAVAGIDRGHVAGFAARHGISACYDSFASMLDAERLDAVYVCIPPFAHRDEVELACGLGVHVFLEKPIAPGSAQAARMVAAIETAGVRSQVGFHMRFRKSVRALKQRIDSGEAGPPTLFTGRYWVNMDGAPWWRDRARSGGQVFEQAIHLYDLARHLCGDVATVQGLQRNLCHQGRPDYTIEDTSVGTLQFRNGALGVITGSNCAIRDHFIGDFRLVCGTLTCDYSSTGQPWVTPDSARIHRAGTVEVLTEDEDPYLLETRDFIAAIREDRPAATPAREGLEAIRMVEAARSVSPECQNPNVRPASSVGYGP